MSFPSSITTEVVRGQFFVGRTDGPDADQEPEAIPAQGTVVFVPSVPYLPVPTASPNPFTILPEPRVAVFDSAGYLSTPLAGTLDPAYRGMRLETNDDPDISVQGWTWTATYKFTNSTKSVPTHSFVLNAGNPVDLTTVVKVPASAGIGTEQAEALAAAAQAAAVSAAADATRAAAAATAAGNAAQVTDSNIANLVANPETETAMGVVALVSEASADKLSIEEAILNFQSLVGLDANAGAKARANGTALNLAIKAIANTAASGKLDTAAAETTYAAKSVETSKLNAAEKAAASGVASLDAAVHVPTAQIPAGLPTDQYDYVAALAARSKTVKMQIRKINSTNEVEVSCLSANGNHTTYQFYGNAGGDDYRVLAQIWTGTSTAVTSQTTKKVFTDGTYTGTYATFGAGSAVYTTDKTTPATFTTSFTVDVDGSDLRFHTYRDNRGGLWEVKLTGPVSATLTASAYSATAGYNTAGIVLVTNLRPGTYTVVCKFLGDDPLNIPSGGAGTARGWLGNYDTAASTSAWIFDVYAPFRQINKETLVKPASNMDFAIQVKPAGGPTLEWVPYHGTATAFQADAPVYLDGDTTVDVAAMAIGAYRAVTSFELVQRVYGRNTSSGATNLMEIATSQIIKASGQLTVNGRWKALADIVLGDNYVIMFPASMALFDKAVSSIGNTYPNSPTMAGTETALVKENDLAAGYLLLASTAKATVAAARFNNVQETIRRGKANKNPDTTKAFLQHRDANIVKVYNRPYAPGTTIPAGTVHRFSGDYIYTTATGAYDQLAL